MVLQFSLKPQLVTVVLKVAEISLKSQLQTVVLQFPLKPQLVTVVLQLFLIRPHFNGVIILILFLKYFFYQNNHKTTVIQISDVILFTCFLDNLNK